MRKLNTLFKSFLFCIFILSLTISVSAHPGRTDSNGGHYNRKTGEYHYHNGSSAGRNTGGNSDSYSYFNFVGPTTDYSYNSNTGSTTKNTKEENEPQLPKALVWVIAVTVVICFNFVIPMLLDKNAKKHNTKPANNKSTQNSAEITEEDIQKTLDKFRAEDRKRWQKAREEQEKITNKRLEQKAGFPEGIYIDGFTLNDTNSTEPYGRATAYINNKNKTIHLFQNCDNATHPINMLFDTYEMKNFKLCEKCKKSGKYNFYLNYETWYKEYIKMKIAEEKDEHENI